ncbi:hypothetical protein L1987_16403 [Smallanthus sonchifolius]|uniref:Uncharacterized protein n=1 Tax=Smallanthus sonchifolius TaxID=185202 RepID=A0ACB9J850_9ASTR|nr:hypothetical protein L1987_16403 [Smallanthus sonchifolius]
MTQVKLSFCFVVVLYVFTSARFCYTDNNPTSREKAEVQKILNRLNKPPVKSIKSPDGDIIDCVRISHQPAFDHPLLKNHTIKMKPDYYPNGLNVDDIKVSSKMNASKHNEEDVLRAKSVKRYGKKKNFSVAQQNLIDAELDVQESDEYASAYANGRQLYGTKATLNVWNPKVQDSNELSLAQIWIVGCHSDDANTLEDINTIEAGWHVHPELYGGTNTRLFIFWTGTQYEITILIWKDPKGGDWWMRVGDKEIVGYWPSSLFSHLCEHALLIEWGGDRGVQIGFSS